MFENSVSKICILLFFTLFIGGCAETITAVGHDTANIVKKLTGDPGVQTVKVKPNLKSVNVRQDPSIINPPILTLPGGMEVMKISETADWVQVRLDMDDGTQKDGWINKDVLVADETANSPGQSQVPPNSQPEVQTVKVKSKFKEINVRRDPSTKSPSIAALPGGMEVLKISEKAGWVHIRLDMEDGSQIDGWISKKMVD